MRKTCFLILLMLVVFASSPVGLANCLAAAEPPVEGGRLPEINLPVPDNAEEKKYLGLDQESFFRIPQIKADVVIVEMFSMYCPHCQKEAPIVNKLYQAIQNSPALNGKIKIIGIGGGNTPYEVKLFKDRYKIPFALFPDADFSIHQLVGEVRTPYFIAVKINSDGSHRVIYSKLGGFGDPDDFLELIVKKSGLMEGE